MSSSPNRTMKLPRLRTKDELLKTSPELFGKLLLGDEMSTARSTAAPSATQPSKSLRPVQSAGRTSMGRTPSRAGQLGGTYDTPRGFGDEPMSIDQELAIELESVKRERQQLMDSIAQVKAEAGTAGGEAQQSDITQLLKELELKKAKLNELRGESRKAEADIARCRDDDTDAQRLTPDGCVVENNYIQALHDEMAQVDEDLLEADAKNRLYQLLGERTRQEHMALDQKVRDKQDSLRACMEDLANLTDHYNNVRAAKELAQKELAKIKRQVEEARHDWTRKIRERRAEVNELQRRQRKEHEKEVKRREKLQEKEKTERATQAKLKMEEEAYQLQVAALAPKIEAMEASWNRLRAISGAETPEQVIEYWQGLQAKESRMCDLVSLAEKREAACKDEISNLLASRSTMYESRPSSSQTSKAAAAAAAAPVPAAADAAEGEEQEQPEMQDEDNEETAEAAAAKIEEAERRMEAAQGQFNKLRGICVAAEQGMRSLVQRLSLALEAPLTIGPSAQLVAHDVPGGQSSAGQQAGAPGSRLTSAGGLSSMSGGHGDGMRRSAAGSTNSAQHHRRPSKDHGMEAITQQAALASKAQRLNSSRARGHPDSASSAGAGGLALVPENSAGSRQRGSQDSGIAASSSRPVLPSRGRNTIDDDSFFEGLPQLLTEVTDKLEKLMSSGQGLDLSAIAAAAAQVGVIAGSGFSSAASTARRRSGGTSSADITPRGAAIRSMHAGLLPMAAENLRASSDSARAAADAARASQASNAEGASSRASAADGAARASQATEAAAPEATPAAAAASESDPAAAAAAAEGGASGEAPAPAAGEEGADPAAAAEAAAAAAADAAPPAAEGEEGEGAAAAGDAASTRPATAEPGHTAGIDAGQGAAAAAEGADASQQEPAAATAKPAAAATVESAAAAAAPAAAAPASAAATPGSFIATQSPAVAAARSSAASSILLNEKALLKGLHRRTWVGAPWLDAVSDNPLDMNLVPSMKRKKGKKKEAAAGPDLNRILGYIPPGDVPAESESDGDADGLGEAGAGADGVVDREYIKMRAAKITARHNAKAAAAAAAQSQQSR